MQLYVAAQTNHKLTKVYSIINWHGDLFTNEENLHGKNPTEWF